MAGFKEIIFSNNEELTKFFYKLKNDETPLDDRLKQATIKLGLRAPQVVCAFGFNRYSRENAELLPILGFVTYDEMAQERNDIFTTDIYKYLTLDNILSIYSAVKEDPDSLQLMPYLLKKRLENIEA